MSRVKVTSTNQKGNWYATKIGEEFEVEEAREWGWIVYNPDGWASHQYSISKEDGVVVEPPGPKAATRSEKIEEQWERAYQLLAEIEGLRNQHPDLFDDYAAELGDLLNEMEELHIPEGEVLHA